MRDFVALLRISAWVDPSYHRPPVLHTLCKGARLPVGLEQPAPVTPCVKGVKDGFQHTKVWQVPGPSSPCTSACVLYERIVSCISLHLLILLACRAACSVLWRGTSWPRRCPHGGRRPSQSLLPALHLFDLACQRRGSWPACTRVRRNRQRPQLRKRRKTTQSTRWVVRRAHVPA